MIPVDWLDNLAAPHINRGAGVAVVGALGDEVAYRFRGHIEANGPPPAANTLFELGAVTQIFTSVLLAHTIRKGLLDLDQPVATLLPELKSLPDWITPLRLATHNAGLPRLPTHIARKSITNTRNPYAQFTLDDLIEWVAAYRSRKQPATTAFAHSILGMGLLGLALAVAYDAPLERILEDEICAPLGLSDTVYLCSDEQLGRLATPHDGAGRAVEPWAFPGLMGAGGLKSTPKDIGRLLNAILAAKTEESELALAIRDTLEIRRPAPRSDGEGGGLGWAILHAGKPPAFIHRLDGITNGSQALIAVAPGPGLGAAILTNSGPRARDALKPPRKQMMSAFTLAWSLPAAEPTSPTD